MISYSIAIPAHNAENSIGMLLSEVMNLSETPEYILIINDGSSDKTGQICAESNVELITNKKNRGKGYSLRRGFNHFLTRTDSDYLLCMDADLQHPVRLIPEFLSCAEANHSSFVIGARKKSLNIMPIHRIFSNSITSMIISLLTGQYIKDSQCGFRLIHRDVLKKLSLNESGFQLESEMILKAGREGIRIEFLDIPTIYNKEKSNISNLADTIRFVRLIVKEVGYRFRCMFRKKPN